MRRTLYQTSRRVRGSVWRRNHRSGTYSKGKCGFRLRRTRRTQLGHCSSTNLFVNEFIWVSNVVRKCKSRWEKTYESDGRCSRDENIPRRRKSRGQIHRNHCHHYNRRRWSKVFLGCRNRLVTWLSFGGFDLKRE